LAAGQAAHRVGAAEISRRGAATQHRPGKLTPAPLLGTKIGVSKDAPGIVCLKVRCDQSAPHIVRGALDDIPGLDSVRNDA
jgi:hypothetical protein